MSNGQAQHGFNKITKDGPIGSERVPIISVEELIPFCGIICCFSSLYLVSPNCIGCVSKDVICCCYHETLCCKPTREPGFHWVFFKSECLNSAVGNCMQCDRQCCCFDIRCSIPTFSERPCLLTVCFFTCCYNYKCLIGNCCSNVRDLEDAFQKKEVVSNKKFQNPYNKATSNKSTRSNQSKSPKTPANQHGQSSSLDEEERQSDASFLDIEEEYSSPRTTSRDHNGIISTSTDGDLRNNNIFESSSVDIYQSQQSGYQSVMKSASGSPEMENIGKRSPSPVPNNGQSKQSRSKKTPQQGNKKL